MKRIVLLGVAVAVVLAVGPRTYSHCQIPCGIYDDHLRFSHIAEDITTIETAMQRITALSAETPRNANQIVRWVTNKEKHAQRIQDTVSGYFMTQRIVPADENDTKAHAAYVTKLTYLHRMLIGAAKCKQSTNVTDAAALRKLSDEFHNVYHKH